MGREGENRGKTLGRRAEELKKIKKEKKKTGLRMKLMKR